MGIAGILLGPVCAAAAWAVWRQGRTEATTGDRGRRRGRPRRHAAPHVLVIGRRGRGAT